MQVTLRALLALLLSIAVSSCGLGSDPGRGGPSSVITHGPTFPTTLSDFQGRSVTVAARPERIVSIGPSNTEFLFALGAGARVVGVDDFSDEPAGAKAKAKVGGVKVNVEHVVSLRPDLVVTVVLSDGTIERLAGAGITVLVVDPQGVPDVGRTATLLGRAVGEDGEKLAADIQRKLDDIRRRTASASPRPRVFHEVDASDPSKLFTVGPGSFIADLIDIAGGVNIAARAASKYPQLSAEEIVRSDPEVIVLGDADYGVTPAQVRTRPGWSQITAVRSDRVHGINANLVSRPGPRVAEAAEAYAKILHPQLFR